MLQSFIKRGDISSQRNLNSLNPFPPPPPPTVNEKIMSLKEDVDWLIFDSYDPEYSSLDELWFNIFLTYTFQVRKMMSTSFSLRTARLP